MHTLCPPEGVMAACPCRFHRRRLSLRQALAITLLLSIAMLYYSLHSTQGVARPKVVTELISREFCAIDKKSLLEEPDDLDSWASNQVRVLVFTSSGSAGREVKELLGAVRLKYKAQSPSKLPDVIKAAKGTAKYLSIIFVNIMDYYGMNVENRKLLDKYCEQFKIGILGFLPSTLDGPLVDEATNSSLPFSVSHKFLSQPPRTTLHPSLRILKKNLTLVSHVGADVISFSRLGESVEPLISTEGDHEYALAVLDTKGVSKVVIGGGSGEALKLWYIRLLLLDSLHHLSGGRVSLPLTRYLMVDIDDIFVGTARLVASDVAALLESQNRLRNFVPGFTFNLGFSGKTFLQGDDEEDEGDRSLIRNRDNFWWFPHMWRHLQPHRFNNLTELAIRMELNKKFSKEQQLLTDNRYAVAPHHSGVYPVHQQLFSAWRQVWGISVTSTEEYPNLRPARRRRGFQHSAVSVLPRQTCGLYTKNTHYNDYPGGPGKLEASISGGELFMSIVTNPISIYMTHMPNYCCDRLAPYTFESVASFVACNTNLKLKTVSPLELAKTYFKLFPEEKQAIWGDPCEDKRHLEIWSEKKTCDRLPQVLIVGPQKTGTTALSTFLQLHPSIIANHPSEETFEEVQFFRGPNYALGIDWYMDFFPVGNSSVVLFEKSATYFDGEEVPGRAHRLLPGASIVVVLLPPGERAYSWYQHQRAHSDPTALNYTWTEVLAAGPASPRPLLSLQAHCLDPGKYAAHLEHWLVHYRPRQLHIVDGAMLKTDPVSVLNDLQEDLSVSPFMDFGTKLVYDKRKGFFCMLLGGRKKCLGKGKGRNYPPMDQNSRDWLHNYYKKANENLEKMLVKMGNEVPGWLSGDLSTRTKNSERRTVSTED